MKEKEANKTTKTSAEEAFLTAAIKYFIEGGLTAKKCGGATGKYFVCFKNKKQTTEQLFCSKNPFCFINVFVFQKTLSS